MNIDRVRSRSLAQAIDAQPKRCWRNCALGLGHLLGAGLYVEGVAVTHFGFATPHAWIETDRTILDPTWDRPGTQYQLNPNSPFWLYLAQQKILLEG